MIFAQGDAASFLYYLHSGKIKLSVVSNGGKEAVIALLHGEGFFGEACLTAQQLRTSSATAMSDCSVTQMDSALVARVLREQPSFAELLFSHVLTRIVRIEADLVDHLFNSSEKRLARALLLLANFGSDSEEPHVVIAKISQETLAEMIGTTRSRVNVFMNKFRKLGYIKYNGVVQIHRSLLNVILHD